jgi:hypothetical protein
MFISSLFFSFPPWVLEFNSALKFRVCYSVNSLFNSECQKKFSLRYKLKMGNRFNQRFDIQRVIFSSVPLSISECQSEFSSAKWFSVIFIQFRFLKSVVLLIHSHFLKTTFICETTARLRNVGLSKQLIVPRN